MEARIVKFKVRKSMKKMLIIGNGKPYGIIGIHLNKTFKAEDAEALMKIVNTGRF